VAVVDTAGKETVLSSGWASLEGIAWSPNGNEIWFTGTKEGSSHNLYAVSLGGRLRQLASMPAEVQLQDVRPDGRMLLKKQSQHFEIYSGAEGQSGERRLEWLDWSRMTNLSDDGKFVLFDEEGEGGGPEYTVYIRNTDGSPAVALGHGGSVAISPDNQWVLAATLGAPVQFILLPTGAGEPRKLTNDAIDHIGAHWMADGKHILFIGREKGHASRLYMLDVDSGATRPISPEGIRTSGAISADGKQIIVMDHGAWVEWPLEGGDPKPVAGLTPSDIPLQWSQDGRSLFIGNSKEFRPRRVYQFDLATGKRTLWKSLGPQDWTGVGGVGNPQITRDGKHYSYLVVRTLSDLYVVNGLK